VQQLQGADVRNCPSVEFVGSFAFPFSHSTDALLCLRAPRTPSAVPLRSASRTPLSRSMLCAIASACFPFRGGGMARALEHRLTCAERQRSDHGTEPSRSIGSQLCAICSPNLRPRSSEFAYKIVNQFFCLTHPNNPVCAAGGSGAPLSCLPRPLVPPALPPPPTRPAHPPRPARRAVAPTTHG
jgi:hypothetical protein